MRRVFESSVRLRVLAAILALVGVTVALFAVFAPPERCPSVTSDDLNASATEAVDWFTRNQLPDGRWLYLYDADEDLVANDYSVIRHMGVQMSLYQAAAAGIPNAQESADRGLEWSLEQLTTGDGWRAVTYRGETAAGGSALLAAGLAERRMVTGDDQHDQLLRDLGAFLVQQTEQSGAVLGSYDAVARQPLPETYSPYYTGETYWALTRLHRLFPDEHWGAVADRIGGYLSADRDRAEGYWPPLPDHWAAYGLSETVQFEERAPSEPLNADERAYARRQAGLFSSQVRWLSQQIGPWGVLVRGPQQVRGGGYGVIGEALTGLWHVARTDARLAGISGPIAARAVCHAGITVTEQIDAAEAAAFQDADRVRGAWLVDGETRMDDQQHALSAILRTIPVLEAGDHASSGAKTQASAGWLWGLAIVAAVNPFRVSRSIRNSGRTRAEMTRLAVVGGLVGAAIGAIVAIVSVPILDAVGVSGAALRVAVGLVAGVVGVAMIFRGSMAFEPAPPGMRAALVPVAVPLVVNVAVLPLVIGSIVDHGVWPVALGMIAGVGTVSLATVGRWGPSRERLYDWAARVTAVGLVVAAVQITIDGVFAV